MIPTLYYAYFKSRMEENVDYDSSFIICLLQKQDGEQIQSWECSEHSLAIKQSKIV